MTAIFDIIGIPLGYVLWFIYRFISNYFVAIFLFTVLIRAITFPLSLKSQKSQADRARLAPRLERLQKKYAQDKQKLQQKQMELYEKEGVSMTGGCLPMLLQMVILMGIISVIYSPMTHLARIPAPVINATVSAVTLNPDVPEENKVHPDKLQGYYRELETLKVIEPNKQIILDAINGLSEEDRAGKTAEEYYEEMNQIREDFSFFGRTLLDSPWNERGFAGINILWLIPLISGLTAFASSLISLHYTKQLNASGEKMPGQGCSNVMMLAMMPLFSLFITFGVPGGVGIYWICSNIIAVVQTVILNNIYNPAKIRAQAEAEYEERRRKKAEDKKRLKEARLREEEEARRQAKEEAEEKERARLEAAAAAKKPVEPSKNPNKIRKREAAEKAAAAEDTADQTKTEKQEEKQLPLEESTPADQTDEKPSATDEEDGHLSEDVGEK